MGGGKCAGKLGYKPPSMTKQDKTVYFRRPPAPGQGGTLYVVISNIDISCMVKTI